MLPTWCIPKDITIVVIPLIALRDHMQACCNRAEINYRQQNPRRLTVGGETILMTPKSALFETFQSYVNLLTRINLLTTIDLLDRIVIDEYHVVLHDQTTFRK